ncbi:MAG: hypothetical protein F6K19_07110 [Cyanothece sp. SIO1E1]|nr:hypothetical protein [Cyanothece sp. SIO1E1]
MPNLFSFELTTPMATQASFYGAKLTSISIRNIASDYWIRLLELGVPSPDAWNISVAIAKFDAKNEIPNSAQKGLISQHCPIICRAKLWRRQLI